MHADSCACLHKRTRKQRAPKHARARTHTCARTHVRLHMCTHASARSNSHIHIYHPTQPSTHPHTHARARAHEDRARTGNSSRSRHTSALQRVAAVSLHHVPACCPVLQRNNRTAVPLARRTAEQSRAVRGRADSGARRWTSASTCAHAALHPAGTGGTTHYAVHRTACNMQQLQRCTIATCNNCSRARWCPYIGVQARGAGARIHACAAPA